MTAAGADIVVAHMGVTVGGSIGASTAKTLDTCVGLIDDIAEAALEVRKDVIVLCHGGPIATPEDAQYVLKRTRNCHGFYGASSMERLPTEVALTEQTRRFKSVQFPGGTRMTKVFVSAVIDAPVEKVWSKMRDFNGLPDWHPRFSRSHIEGRAAQRYGRLRAQLRHRRWRRHDPRTPADVVRLRLHHDLLHPRRAAPGEGLRGDAQALPDHGWRQDPGHLDRRVQGHQRKARRTWSTRWATAPSERRSR